jgi:hypothetical protein
MVKGTKVKCYGFAIGGAELADISRGYNLQLTEYMPGYSPRVRTPTATSAKFECAATYLVIALIYSKGRSALIIDLPEIILFPILANQLVVNH